MVELRCARPEAHPRRRNTRKEGLTRKLRWTSPLTIAACSMGAPAHADRFAEVVVVTHVDIDPQFVPQAEPLLVTYVEQSRNDPGVIPSP
jgi:hypothetical protein